MGRLSDAMLGDQAYARTTDPQTSHAAAESVNPEVTDMEAIVLSAIRATPDRGAILDEIVERTGMEKVTVSPRLKPLIRKELIEIRRDEEGSEVTRKGRAGRQQIVWFAR